MIDVLYPLALRRRADYTQAQMRRLQIVLVAAVIADTEQQRRRIGPIFTDHIGAQAIPGCKGQMRQAEHHIAIRDLRGLQPPQISINRLKRPWQARVVNKIGQVGRADGDDCAASVILVLAATTEHVVIQTQADHRPTGLTALIADATVGSQWNDRQRYDRCGHCQTESIAQQST